MTMTSPDHPGWKLSRFCILDTLMGKREGGVAGSFSALYYINIKALRETQLSPYVEAWRSNRYLDMQNQKRAAPTIVVVVRGGMVQEVRASNKYTTVMVADYDCDHDDLEEEERLCAAEERGNKADMHIVY